jgi:hypothetical protein
LVLEANIWRMAELSSAGRTAAMTDRKKPGVAFWATVVVVVVLVGYPLSMGLSYRMLIRYSPGDLESREWIAYRTVYAPIIWVYDHGPKPVQHAINLLCAGRL